MGPSKKSLVGAWARFFHCVEVRGAYFEDEDQRWILQRTGKR